MMLEWYFLNIWDGTLSQCPMYVLLEHESLESRGEYFCLRLIISRSTAIGALVCHYFFVL